MEPAHPPPVQVACGASASPCSPRSGRHPTVCTYVHECGGRSLLLTAKSSHIPPDVFGGYILEVAVSPCNVALVVHALNRAMPSAVQSLESCVR